MSNIFDYLIWRGDLSFTQSPLNPVDTIILCQLSYLPFEGIVSGPREKQEISVTDAMNILHRNLNDKNTQKKPVLMFKEDSSLIGALGSSNRFGSCRLCGYINHIDTKREIQFSALCINTGDGSHFIVYRGTDMNFVGWKEDFNMSFCEVVPSQRAAADYLNEMAGKVKGPLRIGGHSKGGNLAVYAASQCSAKIQRRITDIYSNDAPGFHQNIIASEGFTAIRERIHAFIPQSSVVGLLLEHGDDYTVIKSSQTGLLQHHLYSWEITHNNMVYVDNVSLGSRFVDKTLREWIATLDNTRREQFFEALYTILSASQAQSLPEFEKSWPVSIGRIIQSLGDIDESTKHLIRKTLVGLFQSARNNINTLFKNDESTT